MEGNSSELRVRGRHTESYSAPGTAKIFPWTQTANYYVLKGNFDETGNRNQDFYIVCLRLGLHL